MFLVFLITFLKLIAKNNTNNTNTITNPNPKVYIYNL